MATPARPFPRDGRLISLILASKGIEDTDERVIHQLLDFAHRYTADVLQSAQSLADHASGSRTGPSSNKIEKEDVELAIQLRKRYEFFEAPPRDYLSTLAHELNSQPLPILPESFDLIRLPPLHQRLGEVNFDIIPESNLTDDEDDQEEDEGGVSSEEGDDEEDRQMNGNIQQNGDRDGDGDDDDDEDGNEDEDMEEVNFDQSQPQPSQNGPVRQEREVDEDYDI